MRAPLVLSACFLAATACQHSAPAEETQSALAEPEPVSPLAFARQSCGECHSVEKVGISPHPEAPTFGEIAAWRGVNRESLIVFLRDAHNYPEAMDFELSQERVEQLADYMVTLQ